MSRKSKLLLLGETLGLVLLPVIVFNLVRNPIDANAPQRLVEWMMGIKHQAADGAAPSPTPVVSPAQSGERATTSPDTSRATSDSSVVATAVAAIPPGAAMAGGYNVYKYSYSTALTEAAVTKQLVAHGVSLKAAKGAAGKVLRLAKSRGVRGGAIAVAAGGATILFTNVVGPKKQRHVALAAAAAVMTFTALLYLILRRRKILS